jgi:hypothetical protein
MKQKTHEPAVIRFPEGDFRLSVESLSEQTGYKKGIYFGWFPTTLRFDSFINGSLNLVSTCNNEYHQVLLKMIPDGLQASCDCKAQPLCCHIHGTLRTLIFGFREDYFKKLLPDGAISLAFKYPQFFDKCESRFGLDATPRVELKTVFQFGNDTDFGILNRLLQFPDACLKKQVSSEVAKPSANSETAIGYLVIIPLQNRFQPFVVPCAGILNKAKTEIKFFFEFLMGIKKTSDSHLSNENQELSNNSFQLLKMGESLPGQILDDGEILCNPDQWQPVLNLWHNITEDLARQQFVYLYFLPQLGMIKKGRPSKQRVKRIKVSVESPIISFTLIDYGVFYQFALRVMVGGSEIKEFESDTTYFIADEENLYLLQNLRDAAIVQWMNQLEGVITVFKEHFSRFETEVLIPIRSCYEVSSEVVKK